MKLRGLQKSLSSTAWWIGKNLEVQPRLILKKNSFFLGKIGKSSLEKLRIHQRLGKNMFSIWKNWILNTLGILCMPHYFGIGKDPQ